LTLLFIHGAGASPSVWRLQLAHFKGAIAVELPGHPSGHGCSTIDDYASVVEQYLREKTVRSPVLVGHSMGGAIAMTHALRGYKLAGLVLVGTGARLRVHPDILRGIKENYEEVSRLIASWSVSPRSDPVIAERIGQDLLHANPEVVYGDFIACDKFDRMNDLQKIACKTLIVVGADDRMTPVKYSQYLHDGIANSTLIVVPEAGHSVMLEKPRAFNGALEGFLGSL
jgi:pimeloyl-ACP methyl ester carboxylesterase